ncbi:hypothetical protein BGX34_000057 [Mortierella sp. NVP85]|nr:hypothetical protein BGX34_000057 [Mortierella sp. NVP85]
MAGDGTLPSFMSEIDYNVVMVEQGERIWDQGSWLANWKSIMGPTWWLWFVPYRNTPGDGIHDIYNDKTYKRLVSDALAQARLQVVNFGPPNLASDASHSGAVAIPQHSDTGPDAMGTGQGALSPDLNPPDRQRASRGSIGRSSILSPPSVRFGLVGDDAYGSSADSDRPLQNNQGESTLAYFESSASHPEVPLNPPMDEDPQISQEGRGSGSSTPIQQSSTRPPGSRQRSLKSQSASSSRRRQRTMSGGTVGSYVEFGMGLGMDGVPVNSSTGLKLSSGRGWSNQSYGKSYGRQQQDL